MDEIEFRVQHRDLGVAPQDCVELIVNGRNLGELLGAVEGRGAEVGSAYAGLPPDLVFASRSRFLDAPAPAEDQYDGAYEDPGDGERRRAFVLRCTCGDQRCGFALAKIRVEDERVVWSELQGSRLGRGAYAELGPFHFDRARYETALARGGGG